MLAAERAVVRWQVRRPGAQAENAVSELAEVGAYVNNQLAAIRLVLGELPKQTPEHQGAISDALECIANATRVANVLVTGVNRG